MSWDPAEQHRPRRSLRFRHRNAAPSLGHRLCMECTVAIRDPQNALMQSVKCCMALSVCPPLSLARALSRCHHASLARNAADAPLAHRRCHPGVPRPNLSPQPQQRRPFHETTQRIARNETSSPQTATYQFTERQERVPRTGAGGGGRSRTLRLHAVRRTQPGPPGSTTSRLSTALPVPRA